MTVVWSNLAKDAVGLTLFILWLTLPPLYVATLGRRYVRQCQESATAAAWALDELRTKSDPSAPPGKHHREETP
ncbi:hypothetical protein [Actinosynnema sp. NPDC020468]|uniref:hypothetical protein n=1 Tax=Actinosynnema sp. NPDC020468 TaxID=3154488 RepID=UPI0033FE4201